MTAIVYGPLDEILLVRQRDGNVWSTPGGSVEIDESPIDAVVRETWEETGLLVKPDALIGVFGGPNFVIRYAGGDETQYVMSVFECSVKFGEITNESDEVTACRFVSEPEFRTLAVSPWTKDVLPLCYSRPRQSIIGDVTWTPPNSSSLPSTG